MPTQNRPGARAGIPKRSKAFDQIDIRPSTQIFKGSQLARLEISPSRTALIANPLQPGAVITIPRILGATRGDLSFIWGTLDGTTVDVITTSNHTGSRAVQVAKHQAGEGPHP